MPEQTLDHELRRLLKLAISNAVRERVPYTGNDERLDTYRGKGDNFRVVRDELGLTPTQRRIVDLLAEGLAIPDIASQLVVSRNTVTTHLGNIYRVLGVHGAREVVARVNTSNGVSLSGRT